MQRRGSEATSLEELPRGMVKRLDGHVWMVLMLISHMIFAGIESLWLQTCLQPCIAKKVPEWFVRNSRPILLEGYINRNGDNNVFQRSQRRAETRGEFPTTCFAYRKQLSPQHAAIAARIVTAMGAVQHNELWCLDWDEKNAFCNSVRTGRDAVSKDVASQVEDWVRAMYDKMRILLVSPHGLLGPYPMQHGGPQGSSMGVGLYNNVAVVRTEFVHGVLANGLSPETMEKTNLDLHRSIPRMPWDLEKILPQICYSDDRRGYALTKDGLNYLLRTVRHAWWSTRGSVNFLKLKIFLIRFERGRLKYGEGEHDTYLGPMHLTNGLMMTRIPLLVGHEPKECLENFKRKLNGILKAAGRTQPTYVLALRIILSFAVASPDYFSRSSPSKENGSPSIKSSSRRLCVRYWAFRRKRRTHGCTCPSA